MAAFKFQLASLLEHRHAIERDHQRKVAQIQSQINQLMDQVRNVQQTIQKQNAQLAAENLIGRLDLGFIAAEKRYVGTLHVNIVAALQKIAAAEKLLNSARVELIAATKARKVLEKLRDKQWARWRENQNRVEAAQADEVGTQLTLRKLRKAETSEYEGSAFA